MCHSTHYTKAIDAISRHGHFATITLDGVLAISGCVDRSRDCEAMHYEAALRLASSGTEHRDTPDTYLEETTVFPVDDAGMVPSAMVRTWLGY